MFAIAGQEHHTTVLYSISKTEETWHSDKDLNFTVIHLSFLSAVPTGLDSHLLVSPRIRFGQRRRTILGYSQSWRDLLRS